VLVLIDGRSVYSPFFGGVFWDVQNLPLQDVDRIEVIRGPGGTIWGPDAVNGVINVITKSAGDTKGVLLSGGGGTVDRTNDVVQYGGGLGDVNYRVYGKGFADGPEYHVDGNNYDSWHQERGGFRSDWEKTSDTVMLEGDLYGGNSPHLVGSSVSNDSVSGGDLTLHWRRAFSNGSDLNVESYFERTIRIGPVIGETRDTFDIDVLDHIKLGEHQDWSLGGGLRWSPDHYQSNVPGDDVLPHREVDTLHSLFAQDEIHTADERMSLTLGVKIGYNNFTGFDAQPTLRLLYAPNKKQSFWAAVTRAVTTPSRLEEGFLLSGEIAPGTDIVVTGNPNFKSEYLLGYEGGYRQFFTKKIYLDVAAFHNDYSQLQSFTAPIMTTPAPGQTDITIAYANQIGGDTNGVEIAPSWQVVPWWRLTGSYSYVGIDMHANAATSNISATGSVPTYEGSTPHHESEVQSTIDFPKRFEFDQFYRWASALPAQKVPGYQTMDVRLGWRYSPRVEFSLVGQNLFQPYHFEWGTGDPTQTLVGIKRALFGSITLRY